MWLHCCWGRLRRFRTPHLLVELGLRQRRQPRAEGLQERLDGGVQVCRRMRGGLDDEDLRAAASRISKAINRCNTMS
jgi:hypothetical protein